MTLETTFTLPLLEWCEIPAGRVTVKGVVCALPKFYVAKYPVTYAQYQAFIRYGGYRARRFWTKTGWDIGWEGEGSETYPTTWGDHSWRIQDHPVSGLSWYEAFAFTRWLSEKTNLTIILPTESMWQRAAQGDDGRRYPWGNEFDQTNCNSYALGITRPTPVTQYPNGASPFGVMDMVGNIWEWCLSKSKTPFRFPEDNNSEGKDARISCGGSFNSFPASLQVTERSSYNPGIRGENVGFRVCAMPAP
jgi:formylglycine-generating enzyme required for sulfatase activity